MQINCGDWCKPTIPLLHMSTGLYTFWDLCPKSNSFTPQENNTRSFEKRVVSYFIRTEPDCNNRSFSTTSIQKEIDCFSFDDFCSDCNTVFEAMGCFYHFCPCQEVQPSLTEEHIQRGSEKRERREFRRHYIREKSFTVIEL